MEEDLTKQWERFNLLDAETEEVEAPDAALEPLVDRGTACAVGKLLEERTVGKEILKTPMIRAWQPTGWVSFKTLGPNLFLIEFQHEWDKVRIMEGCPWKFDRDLFSMAEFDGRTPPSELEFEKVPFWVRMYDMPLACMSREMGQRIGASMGVVEEVDVDEAGVGWGEFLRVRIVLDVTKPLLRGRFLKLRDKTIWITFHYERIPRFCFMCGVIKHGGRGCVKPGGRMLPENENLQQFGPWLRVSLPNRFGGGEGGRENYKEAKEGYTQPSNSVAAEHRAKEKLNQGESGGSGSAGTDEVSTETSPVAAKTGNGKNMHTDEGEQIDRISGKQIRNEDREVSGGKTRYLQDDEISGGFIRKDKEDFNWKIRCTQGNGPKGKERMSDGEEISAINTGSNFKMNVTADKNANGGAESNMVYNENILPPKGNNIYVGQWDSIKEKMTWQAVEKEAELVGNLNLESPIHHVEARSPKIKTARKIKVERGPFMSSDLRTEKVAGTQVGKKIRSYGDNSENIRGAKGQVGKRKMQGENYESDREGGKRNKTNMEGQ
jgi:hypothetical protein